MSEKTKLSKYIHLLNANELKFQKPLVAFINDPNNGFAISDHLFVTPHETVFDNLREYPNVRLDLSDEHLINKYAPLCDFIINQGVSDMRTMLMIKRSYLKKVVFRTWGGSHQPVRRSDFGFIRYYIERVKDFGYKLYMRATLGQCAAVGIANMVDIIDLKKWINNVPLIPLNFYKSTTFDLISRVKKEHNGGSDSINILVGHQGDPHEKHYKIVELLLKRFSDQNIHIYVPLSYGNSEYINKAVSEIKGLKSKQVTVLTKLLPFEDYISLLNTIDIGIFDTKTSMALGNICILISLNKKIVLNDEGVIKETFDYFNIPCITSSQLDTISFRVLTNHVEYGENADEFRVPPISKQVKDWNKLFDLLENGSK